MSDLTVGPADKVEYWGTQVADLQDDITVDGDTLSGELKYYDDPDSALVSQWGAGYFVCLKFTDIDENTTSTKVGLVPTQGSGPVELDSDYDAVLKIKDNSQRLKTVQADANGNRNVQWFNLNFTYTDDNEGA